MQVHDELILEVKKVDAEEVLSKVTEIMEAAVNLDIPLIVEASIGSNWNEAH
jgi:DNA polymerase-1